MQAAIHVSVQAQDPLSEEGVRSQLRRCPQVAVGQDDDGLRPDVGVVVGDVIDEDLLRLVRRLRASGCLRVILVAGHVDDAGLLSAVESGVCGLLRRSETTPDRLGNAVTAAAAGAAQLAPDLLGRLLDRVGQLQSTILQPRGIGLSGLSSREIKVLKLVADGCDTSEIARRLSYSERTVKSVLHDVTTRLNLRNRSHAVAYAVRQGLI